MRISIATRQRYRQKGKEGQGKESQKARNHRSNDKKKISCLISKEQSSLQRKENESNWRLNHFAAAQQRKAMKKRTQGDKVRKNVASIGGEGERNYEKAGNRRRLQTKAAMIGRCGKM